MREFLVSGIYIRLHKNIYNTVMLNLFQHLLNYRDPATRGHFARKQVFGKRRQTSSG